MAFTSHGNGSTQRYEPVDVGPRDSVDSGFSEPSTTPPKPTEYAPVQNGSGEPEIPRASSDSVDNDLELGEITRSDPLEEDTESGTARPHGDDNRNWTRRKNEEEQTANDQEQEFGILEEARQIGNAKFVRKLLINLFLIATWYLLSISLSVYNKWMFSPTNLDFHFPMFVTSVHMLVQFTLASAVLYFIPRFRPSQGTVEHQHGDEPLEQTQEKKPLMTPWFYLSRIVSCGTVTGLDIGLGNTSLKFISLTFFTMVKSSTLGFVLGFAILFKLEKPSWRIAFIITVMTVGVIMMVAGETAFDAIGFVLLMLASFCSGLRWSLTQILLRRTPATSNPFSTLFFLTPVMFVVLFVIAVPTETFAALGEGLKEISAAHGLVYSILLLLFPGCIAFCMQSAEFALLKRTSVVTLSVCGIFKEVLTISAAGIIFGDRLSPINISGLVVTILAIAFYNYMRMVKMRRKQVEMAQAAFAGEVAPMLSTQVPPVATDSDPASELVHRSVSDSQGVETSSSPSRPVLVKQPHDME